MWGCCSDAVVLNFLNFYFEFLYIVFFYIIVE